MKRSEAIRIYDLASRRLEELEAAEEAWRNSHDPDPNPWETLKAFEAKRQALEAEVQAAEEPFRIAPDFEG